MVTLTSTGCIPLKKAVLECRRIWNTTPEKAWDRLRLDLGLGAVESMGTDARGTRCRALADWTADYNDQAYLTGIFKKPRSAQANSLVEFRADVSARSLRLYLDPTSPAEETPSAVREDEATGKNPGGRPPTYNAVDFLIEAAAIVIKQGLPERAPELRKATMDAYSARTGLLPSENWARPHIDLAYKRWHKVLQNE